MNLETNKTIVPIFNHTKMNYWNLHGIQKKKLPGR